MDCTQINITLETVGPELGLFLKMRLFVYVWYVCMHVHLWVCSYMCVYVCGGQRSAFGVLLGHLHLTYRGRISHLDPKLTSSSSLASQFAQGSQTPGLQVGCHTPPSIRVSSGKRAFSLTLACQVLTQRVPVPFCDILIHILVNCLESHLDWERGWLIRNGQISLRIVVNLFQPLPYG